MRPRRRPPDLPIPCLRRRAAAGVFALLAAGLPAQTFGELHRMLPAGNGTTAAAALGDVDGDGRNDLLLATPAPKLLRGGVAGALAPDPRPLPAGVTAATDVQLVDVDGDGAIDALVVGAGRLWLWHNDGSGGFTDVSASRLPVLAVGAPAAAAVASGDIDGDGAPDLVVLTAASPRLYGNTGNGTFVDRTSTSLPALATAFAATFADVDLDGDPDLVLVGPGQDRLLRNDGSGGFADATALLPVDTTTGRLVRARDLDGDGDVDLWIAADSVPDRIYRNDGGGGFSDATATRLPAAMPQSLAVALGDVDQDGDLDAVVGRADGAALLRNDGGAFTAVATLARGGFAAALLGDLDQDADLDAFLGGSGNTPGRDTLLLGDGLGAFVDPARDGVPPELVALAFGDIDRDGDLDWFGALGNELQLRRQQDTDLGDAELVGSWLLSGPPVDVALGDVDGDGDLDALVGVFQGSAVLLRNGPGGFTASAFPSAPALTGAVALGDLDGDGDLDAVVGNGFGPSPVLRNDGHGVFTAVASIDTTALVVGGLLLRDLDGDGDADPIVVASGFGGRSRVYRNDAGTFRLVQELVEAVAAAAGDLDGDGFVDVVLGQPGAAGFLSWSFGRVYCYRNDGHGLLQPVAVPQDVGGDPRGLALGDVDRDGDLDVLVRTTAAWLLPRCDRLWRNDGNLAFTLLPAGGATGAPLPPTPRASGRVWLLDADRDGDVDVVHQDEPRVVANLEVQASWRALPRLGQLLEMDLRGQPFTYQVFGVSEQQDSIDVPGVGWIGLGLAVFVPIRVGPFDQDGHGDAFLMVPPNPAFLGARVYGQMLQLAPLRISNREAITVTGF